MKKEIYPCLWFNGQAKQAAEFYCAVFGNSKITSENPMVTLFESAGQKFMCLNGGPQFKASPAVSFFVVCETEEETKQTWQNLLEEGNILMPLQKYDWSELYGWVVDKFGFSWQVSLGKLSDVGGQKFTPCFLFTESLFGKGEGAVKHYTSVFSPSVVDGILFYTAGEEQPEGRLKHAQFRLQDNVFMLMEGPGGFMFTEAVSFVITCDKQEEIDHYWNRLTEGGEESMCGWLKDKYGVSWQVVPAVLESLLANPEKAQRVVEAFLKMKKFDIAALEQA